MSEMDSLCINHLCHILSTAFEISKAISIVIDLISTASLILCVLTIKMFVARLFEVMKKLFFNCKHDDFNDRISVEDELIFCII